MTVEERLTKLEKAVRRWRFLCYGLGGLLVVTAAGVALDYLGLRGTVKAKRFIVGNDKGAAIELDSSSDGDGVISVHDAKGLPRVLIGNSQRGFGTMELYGGADHKLIFIGGSGSGGQIALFNNEKRKVVDLQATKSNCGAIHVNDYDGHVMNGISGDRR